MIEAEKMYTIRDIVKQKLVPGINTYATLYNMITRQEFSMEEKRNLTERRSSLKRVLRTDDKRLVAIEERSLYNEQGTYLVKGSDLIAFASTYIPGKRGKPRKTQPTPIS